ncbi:hypothetical protein CB0940_10656 [Cercospora beticola]|uniref:Uncharacterized protein n=1 Tax=Cercospora beticola TaxID=122368 RepID=A0A2G5HTB2_CERBT|nr:hypothetical protein CB0940_10656 [Cercospora beticola]PIA95777.1 hypothetical protein CB0940_10656 [Cercospora beticola]
MLYASPPTTPSRRLLVSIIVKYKRGYMKIPHPPRSTPNKQKDKIYASLPCKFRFFLRSSLNMPRYKLPIAKIKYAEQAISPKRWDRSILGFVSMRAGCWRRKRAQEVAGEVQLATWVVERCGKVGCSLYPL